MLHIRNSLPYMNFFSDSFSIDLPSIIPYSFLVFLVGFHLTTITYILSIPFFDAREGGFYITQRYGYLILFLV